MLSAVGAPLKSVTIVGASLSGHAAARALRTHGFDGRITLVGDEAHRPYDRPPLSKEFLLGSVTVADLTLESDDEDLGAEWVLGDRATSLDPIGKTVQLASGARITSDVVVIATGSIARPVPAALAHPGVAGLYTLRTLADAEALKAELGPGARMVVIGAGFIGAEVASTAKSLGLDVTVLEAIPTPLSRQLGTEMGQAVADLHGANGVTLISSAPVARIHGSTRVTGVELGDGRVFPADVVVAGIGSLPAVNWLVGSGLAFAGGHVSGGLLTDAQGSTAADGVLAVGDCAAWFDPTRGVAHRIEHWTDSRDRAALAVSALLNHTHPSNAVSPKAPYFWSDQYGVRIQFAGHRLDTDDVTIESGSAAGADLLAVWRRDGVPVAVLGLNQPKAFTRIRRGLVAPPQPAVLPV